MFHVDHFFLTNCGGQGRPSAATASAAPSGRAVKGASLFDGGRGQYYTDLVFACVKVLFTLGFLELSAPIIGKFVALFMALLPRRFCALTERLCLSNSPQACWREA